MKVGMVGLPGCGKTTIGYALAKRLDIPFIPEYDKAPNMSLSYFDEQVYKYPDPKLDILKIIWQIAQESQLDAFVADTSIPVLLANFMMLSAGIYDLSNKREESNTVFAEAMKMLKQYDLLVYLPRGRHRELKDEMFISEAVSLGMEELMWSLTCSAGDTYGSGDVPVILLTKDHNSIDKAIETILVACEGARTHESLRTR